LNVLYQFLNISTQFSNVFERFLHELLSAEALAKADSHLVLSPLAQIPQIPQQAAVGVEPTNNGFANRRLRPLGYAAKLRISLILPAISWFYNRILTPLCFEGSGDFFATFLSNERLY
jgi:hypothetical protein